jgi:hypothetical protein
MTMTVTTINANIVNKTAVLSGSVKRYPTEGISTGVADFGRGCLVAER